MYYQDDWLMRQIEDMTGFIAKLLFGKDRIEYIAGSEQTTPETDMLYARIKELIKQKKLCEAENLLYEATETGNIVFLNLAADFYKTLNSFSDKELEESSFSRQEIEDGLKHITNLVLPDFFIREDK